MSERKRKKVAIDQTFGIFKDAPVEHGFRPQGTADNIEEIRKRVKTAKDERMLTGYLLARDTIRNLQKLREEIEEHELRDIQKKDKMNHLIKKILRGSA